MNVVEIGFGDDGVPGSRSLTNSPRRRNSLIYSHAFLALVLSSTVATEAPLLRFQAMKLTNQSSVPVYTISGSSTARPLPEWLARKRKRSLKYDPEYANRIELLQDFEFEEASACVRASEDGDWVVSTGA